MNTRKQTVLLKGLLIAAAFICGGSGSLYAYNQAIYLNGTNNYIEIPHDDEFNLVGDVAIELWIKVDGFETPYATLVSKGGSSWAVRRYKDTGFIQFIYGEDSIVGTTSVNDGRWHHIAATYSFSTILKLYIDGELDAGKINTLPGFPANSNPVCVGTDPERPERLFHGVIDEVKIYDITQAPDDISKYMNVELTELDPRMIAYYRMNNDYNNPSHIIDYTGHGHTGILQHTYGSAYVYSGVIFSRPPKAGDGSSENPYQIDSIGYLFWISQDADRWSSHYIQTADIDASATESLYGGRGFLPIGNHNVAFSGTYFGADHSIDGMYISRADEDTVGLFGNASNTLLSNIILATSNMTGGNFVGGIAGLLDDNTEVNRCSFAGSISGTANVGAMAGKVANSSIIKDCINSGTLSGEDQVGGIAGNNSSASQIIRCCNQGDISATGSNCGGVAGYNQLSSYLINCFSTGAVSGNTAAGGLLGDNDAFVESCHSTGAVSASTMPGGLVGGTGSGTVTDSFWDTGSSGQGSSNGGTGKSSAQMKDVGTYTIEDGSSLLTAWDFVTNPNDDDAATGIWNLDQSANINGGYPFLSWQAPLASQPPGTGTIPDPYLMGNLNHLVWMAGNPSTEETLFRQVADIDAWETWGWDNRSGFLPIGNASTAFTGNYDGAGYCIENLFIHRSSSENTGLFGKTDGADISNLNLIGAIISGSTYTGILAGYLANTTIERCITTGELTAPSSGGGMAGYTTASSLTYCFANVDVTGDADGFLPEKMGGLAGFCNANSQISNCYARGDIYGEYASGGLVGSLENSEIENSYSTGSVNTNGYDLGGLVGLSTGGTVIYSFWDTETSGHTLSAGGTGKTTTEMKMAGTFLAAGWDFDVSDDIWAMNHSENNGYPFLRMEKLVPEDLWIGSASNNWSDAENWSEGEIPSGDVIIPATLSKNSNPVIGVSGTADCNNLTLESGACLTVMSDASGTGSLITTGEIVNSGTIEIQRYITDNTWHLIAIPNSNTLAGLFIGDYLQTWSESSAVWSDVVDPDLQLASTIGYGLWSMEGKATTFSFIGTPNTGNQNLDFTADNPYGWNLVGNPYPSAIDWDLVSAGQTGLNNAVYCFDPTLGDHGQYVAYVDGIGDCRYLSPEQGFFISAVASGTFSLVNEYRTHTGSSNFYKEKEILNHYISLNLLSNDKLTDKLYVQFNNLATSGFDGDFDAVKIGSNSSAEIYTLAGIDKLCIDRRPECPDIQLGFSSAVTRLFKIELNEFCDFDDIFLEDTKTGITHNLLKSSYEFVWDVTDDEMRFNLHLNAVGIEENQISGSDILICAAGQQIFIKGADYGTVTVSDIMGRVLVQQELSGDEVTTLRANCETGVYFVTVTNGNTIKTEKVFIK